MTKNPLKIDYSDDLQVVEMEKKQHFETGSQHTLPHALVMFCAGVFPLCFWKEDGWCVIPELTWPWKHNIITYKVVKGQLV